jgi:peroxiredoxin
MNRRIGILLAGLLLSGLLTTSAVFGQAKTESASMPKVGDTAPDFTLHYFDGNNLKEVKLSDYRGKKNVIVAFYVFAFTGG